ncbi:MAG: prephenate dehydrogenase/arogenate dehydrogenase family protein [Patescibacteria group bacterium]|nr:prephenate dehydrogenase/arogenate dehydrogenase family protein [Patescibacteria group bacterium]
MISSVGIVGHGSFGAFVELLTKRFAPELMVKIYSSRVNPDGKRFFSLSEAASCDVLILAVPIRAFEETLQKVLPLVSENTILVDVATVKLHTTEVLRRIAQKTHYVASHPMFGPESYSKRGGEVGGFKIVIADHTLSEREYASLKNLLAGWGFSVIEMDAHKHDKHLAETLFLTHFIGQTIARGEFDRTAIDTVSFGFLMDAVESVRHDTELFKDVYHFNPYCEDVLERFERCEKEVHTLLERI